MITGIQTLPMRHPPGQVLDSAQTRHIYGDSGVYRIPIGTTVTIPDHFHKLCMSERLGDTWFDRCFVCDQEKMDKHSELIPIYTKIYDQEDSNVLLYLNGINEARKAMGDPTPSVSSLKDCLLDTVLDAVWDRQDAIGDSIREYVLVRPKIEVTNDEVNALSDGDDQRLAGYPWDLANFESKELLVNLLNRQRHFPQQYIGMLDDLELNMHCNTGRGYPLRYELCDIFEPKLGTRVESCGVDPISRMCIKNARIPVQDILAGQPIQSKVGYPSLILSEDIQPTIVNTYSSEILRFCVWLHSCPFAEIVFRTILPNRYTPSRFMLISATARTHAGVDMSLFQLEAESILRSWDCERYQEIVVAKTASEELLLELYGRKPGDVQRYYIDLFMTTLLSQGLVREKYNLIPEEEL